MRNLLKTFTNNNNLSKSFANRSLKSIEIFFFAIEILTLFIEAYSVTITNAIKNFSILSKSFANKKLTIIIFLIKVFKKIETRYVYQEYLYIKNKITLSREFIFDNVCYNIDVNIICANYI